MEICSLLTSPAAVKIERDLGIGLTVVAAIAAIAIAVIFFAPVAVPAAICIGLIAVASSFGFLGVAFIAASCFLGKREMEVIGMTQEEPAFFGPFLQYEVNGPASLKVKEAIRRKIDENIPNLSEEDR